MESIKYILKSIFGFITILIMIWLVLFGLSIFFPALSIKSLVDSIKNSTTTPGTSNAVIEDWFPAPGSLQGLLGKGKAPSETDNIYTPGDSYSGYGNAYNGNKGGAQVDFVTFTSTGTQTIHGNGSLAASPITPPTNATSTAPNTTPTTNTSHSITTSIGYAQKSLYIRNLSIYEGGHIYTGLAFVGEAKATMFKNGKFPIIIANQVGKMVAVVTAEATADWSVPGWVRFQTKVSEVLPNKVPCLMVFQSANATPPNQPLRVAMPILCN